MLHDRMVSLVTQMLDLNKKLQGARLEQEKTMLSRQIEATDGAIDTRVYESHGLTNEDIAVIEAKKIDDSPIKSYAPLIQLSLRNFYF